MQARILVVDDSNTTRTLIEDTLRNSGFSCLLTAANGQQAWEILNSEVVDVVISDLDMPQMDGLELLANLRHAARAARTGFIMLTANSESEKVREAIRLGVDGYIVKPFAPRVLLERVFALLSRFDREQPLSLVGGGCTG